MQNLNLPICPKCNETKTVSDSVFENGYFYCEMCVIRWNGGEHFSPSGIFSASDEAKYRMETINRKYLLNYF